LKDLSKCIASWKEEGDKLIVMGEFNEDIRANCIKNMFQGLGMREIILERRGNTAPNTYWDGTVPIDGIFITLDIHAIQGGYTPTRWGINSDHRLLWIDIDESSIFGNESTTFWRPHARRLKMDDPRIVKRYNHIRETLIKKDNLLWKLITLNNQISEQGLNQSTERDIEWLDHVRCMHIMQADRLCRKFKVGNVLWSPELQQSINRIRYYRSCLSQLQKNKINSRTLLKLYKKTSGVCKPASEIESLRLLKLEYEQYNKKKRESTSLRTNFLHDLAEAKSKEGNTSHMKEIKMLEHRERQREVSQKLKTVFGNLRRGVSCIDVPIGDSWELVTDRVQIEKECMRENIQRRTQANATASLQEGQIDLLGWTGNTEISTSLLDGC
jgi:hypothetical protein